MTPPPSPSDIRLPSEVRLPLNHCNLPPQVLGGLTFQRSPVPLLLDGVETLHGHFFAILDTIPTPEERAVAFHRFMEASFCLGRPEEVGLQRDRQKLQRHKADYLRMLRGWMFDSDSQEGAVLKGWVESRFGLLPRSHMGPLGDFSGENFQIYLAARARGLYNTNALETQLDLVYSYCQYELARQHGTRTHLTLWRGVNRMEGHDILQRPQPKDKHWVLLLNNLNSFTDSRDRADEFGDHLLYGEIPLAKILYYPNLFPGKFRGEQEHMVIGGLYRLKRE